MQFQRVCVIGLDGLEPGIVEPLLAAGELPNLARMRDRGGFARVATTAPAQTPVAWSTFATGTNPGGHGVFDFLRRDPATYLPDLALNRYEQKNAFTPPRAVNLRRGTAVWELLSAAGIASAVVRCPCTYPPDPVRGRMLSGMGVPDLRGGQGTGTYYTAAEGVAAGEGERVVRVEADASGRVVAHLIGPRNPADRSDLRAEFVLEPRGDDGSGLVLRCAAGAPAALELVPGQWSGWLRVRFKAGLLRNVRGIVRFYLVRSGADLALYASPINFDPDAPLFPISAPPEYARELAEAQGLYYTTGMVEDHAALNNGRIDEHAFLDQCARVWDEREAMLLRELERTREGLVYGLFDTPDRVQHLFWRFREPDHPANLGRAPAAEFARTIEEHYRRADAVVGKALALADDRTLTIALSDHGFGSFRRCVDLNAWLHAEGLLALQSGVRPGAEAGDLFRHVDWSRTRAYALGLGGIYLNLQGREAKGTVAADEAEPLKAAIAGKLRGLTDPATGAVGVRDVQPREALYRGPYAGEAPDLLALFSRGHRVSWTTTLGGVAAEVFSDNTQRWSGDHIVDPALVPGVLFIDRPFRAEGAGLADLAPTVLAALGVAPGPAMEGRSLLLP
jgi:predicted AlkP superfamily phosphohydrolase/phosphomutase